MRWVQVLGREKPTAPASLVWGQSISAIAPCENEGSGGEDAEGLGHGECFADSPAAVIPMKIGIAKIGSTTAVDPV